MIVITHNYFKAITHIMCFVLCYYICILLLDIFAIEHESLCVMQYAKFVNHITIKIFLFPLYKSLRISLNILHICLTA